MQLHALPIASQPCSMVVERELERLVYFTASLCRHAGPVSFPCCRLQPLVKGVWGPMIGTGRRAERRG